MINRTIGLVGFFLCLVLSSSAQLVLPQPTAESTDLAHIKAVYSQSGVLSYQMSYRLFPPNATVATDSLKGSLTMSGSNYHAKIATLEYLKEGNQMLYVDHDAHQLVLLPPLSNSAANPMSAGTLAGLLESEGIESDVQILGANKRELSLTILHSGIELMEIWYSNDNYLIERTRTTLAANQAVIEVRYTNYKRQKGKLLASIAQYTTFKNKKYTPTERYKNYRITSRT